MWCETPCKWHYRSCSSKCPTCARMRNQNESQSPQDIHRRSYDLPQRARAQEALASTLAHLRAHDAGQRVAGSPVCPPALAGKPSPRWARMAARTGLSSARPRRRIASPTIGDATRKNAPLKKMTCCASGWANEAPFMSPDKVDRSRVRCLNDLPNVGKETAKDLRLLGYTRPDDIAGECPFDMCERHCEITGVRHDSCVIDVFISITEFLDGKPPRRCWEFTNSRKDVSPPATPSFRP